MKIEFVVSEKVLIGFVSCGYCYKRPLSNYEDVKFHFDYDCPKICVSETCECRACFLYSYMRLNDLCNIHLNQNNALEYYTIGPAKFWGFTEPHILVREWNGSLQWKKIIDAA